jgi:hypothetical protein
MKDIIMEIVNEEALREENRKVWLTEVMMDSLEDEEMDLSVNLWDRYENFYLDKAEAIVESLIVSFTYSAFFFEHKIYLLNKLMPFMKYK